MPSDALPDDSETLKAMLLAERVQNDRLRQIIKELQRHRFGRRAETLPEDQMLLGLEDVEQAEANRAAETDGSSPEGRQARAHKRRILFWLRGPTRKSRSATFVVVRSFSLSTRRTGALYAAIKCRSTTKSCRNSNDSMRSCWVSR